MEYCQWRDRNIQCIRTVETAHLRPMLTEPMSLRWTISNGTCTPSTADITVNFYQTPTTATVGPTQNLCAHCSVAALGGNTPVLEPVHGALSVAGQVHSVPRTAETAHLRPMLTEPMSCAGPSAMVPVPQVQPMSLSTSYQTPTTATVGPTQNLCGILISAALGGNTPVVGTGHGASLVAEQVHSVILRSGIQHFIANTYGTYVLRWTISNGTCAPSSANITVNFYQTPTTATVGANQSLCGTLISGSLGGNTPVVGTGAWAIVSGGTGTFSAPTSGNSTFTANAYGTYVLSWTISNGTCTPSTATVTVSYYSTPVGSNAGPAQNLCNVASTTLAGNNPSPGTGLWTLISGPNSPSITNPNLYNTTVTSMVTGVYVFEWTISNGTCTPSSNTVTITNSALPTTANAGPNQVNCGPISPATTETVTMAANTPSIGSGLWTKISGPGSQTITNPISPTTIISGLSVGVYVFNWTITNGACSSSSNVTITVQNCAPVTYNENIYVCENGSATVNVLANGDYSPQALPLSVVHVPVVLPDHGTLTWTSGSTYTYQPANGYTGNDMAVVSVCDNIPLCTNDTIFINVVSAVTADAGPDQQLCEVSTTTLTGNYPPSGSVGNWTFMSGPIVVNPSPPNTPAATVIGMVPGTTPYVFKYTVTSTYPGTICSSWDTMQVIDYFYPSLPYPGPDQTLCLSSGPSMSTTLSGNTPVYGTGLWVEDHGPSVAVIANPANPTTLVSNLVPGSYAFLWIIGNGNCEPNQAAVNITVNTPATASAGSNATICSTSTYTLSGSSASNYASVTWNTSGSGFFNDQTLLHPIYTPSAADIASGSVTLTLTAISNAPCTNATSSMILTISRQPIASAGSNANVCAGSPAYTLNGASASYQTSLLWTTSGTGSFTPNATTLNPTYTPSAADISAGTVTLTLTAFAAAPCINAVSSMTLTISASATASVGVVSATICQGMNYSLSLATVSGNNGLLWTTSGTGTFSNPAALNPVYTPSAADINNGSVVLTLTAYGNPPCGNATSSMTLFINKSPLANAGPNATVCQGTAYTISGASASNYSGILWTAPGPGTLTNATTLTPTYTPTAGQTGTVVLTLTANPLAGCVTAAVSTMTITINGAATASAGPDATICEGSQYTLSGSNATNYSSLHWTTTGTGSFDDVTLLHPIYTPSSIDIAAGNVTLTLQANANPPCSNATSSILLTIHRQPLASAGSNATVCASSPAYSLNGAGASYQTSLLWTTSGTGSFTPNATTLNPTYTPSAADISAGTVTLTLTAFAAAPCINAVSSMTLTINASATASVGVASATICQDMNYSLSLAAVSGNNGLLWTTSGTGTFSNPAALNPVYTPSAADINNGSVVLTLTAYGNPPCGNANSSMTLFINKSPLANAGPNATVCQGTAYTVSGASASNYSGILWTAPGPGTLTNATTLTPTYAPTAGQTGTVLLTLTANPLAGCVTAAVSTMTITINGAATASAGPDTTICEGLQYTLSGSNATNYSSLHWTTTGTGSFDDVTLLHPIYTPSSIDIASGNVTLTIQANANPPCSNATSSMTLNISRQAIANAGPDETICETSSLTVTGSSAQYYTSINWTSLGTGSFIDPTILHPVYLPGTADINAGSVKLVLHLTSASPCTNATDTMMLYISRQPLANAGPNATICETSTYMLSNATASLYTSLLWTTSGTGTFSYATTLNPIYTPSAADIAAGSVTLTLNAYAAVPCTNVSSSMTLTLIHQAIANAGPDATICETSTYTLSNSTAQYYAGINWTTSGTGAFSNATILHPVYTPSPADIASGSVTLTLNLVANTPCSNTNNSMTLSISRQPVANAGPDATICETSTYTLSNSTAQYYSTLNWTTSGTGTFNNAAILHPIYTPSPADIASGSVILTLQANANAPCNNVTSSMTISITRQAIAFAGPDATICETSAYTLSNSTAQYYAGINWTTSGTGAFSNATILHPVYTPSPADIASGSVTLTLNLVANTPCSNTNSSMTLSISRQPVANAGPNAIICETSNYTLSNSTAQYYSSLNWTTSGTGTFSNPAVLHPVYTPSPADIAAGSVILTLQANANTPCNNVTSSMTLSITRQAIAYAGPNATICETSTYTLSNSTAQYYASINWTTSGTGTFSNATILHPVYTPGAADIASGSVTLTLNLVANTPCSNTNSSMTLSISRQPVANAGPNAIICETSNYTLSNSTAQYYSSLNWTTSGTGTFSNPAVLHPVYTPSPADIAAGSVILTLQANANTPCNNVISSMTLSITRQAIAFAGPDATICETSTYTLSNSTAQYYAGINWTTSGTGAFSNATILHPVYTPSPADIASGSVTLTLNLVANAPCSNTNSSMTLSISRQPVASAGPDATICETSTYTLSNSTAQYYSTLNWTTSGTGTFNNPTILHPVYTPSPADIAAGSVVLTIQANANAPCNNVTSSMTLSITRQAIAFAGPDATICETSTYTLSNSTAQYYASINWTTSGTGAFSNATILHPVYTPSPADIASGSVILTLNLVANSPCSNTSSPMTLSISRQPVASAGPNATICETSTYTLSNSTAQYYSTLNWTTSGTGTFNNAAILHPIYTPSLADIAAGSVILTLQANANAPCNNVTSSMTLSITRQAIAYAGPNATICEASTYTLSNSTAQYYASINWTTSGTGSFSNATILHPVYTPSAADIASGSVILTLNLVANSPCSNTSSPMTLSISRQPVASAGPNATICETSTYTLSNSTAQYYSSLNWTTSGTGTFNNPTILHPVYTPSPADIAAGSVVLTLQANANAPCNNVTSSMTLSITRQAIAYAGPNATICETSTYILSNSTAQYYSSINWTTSGTGTFSNATILHPVYTPSAADIASGSVTLTLNLVANAPCANTSSPMTLSISRQPVASAGPDATICETSTYTLSNSTAQYYSTLNWTTSGTGTFNNPTILHPVYTPSPADIAAGSVVLTIQANANTPCNNVTSSMTLSITRQAIAYAGPNATICETSTYPLSNSTAQYYASINWTSSGTGTFSNATILHPVYTPGAADIASGSVTLTLNLVANAPCANTSSPMTLSITRQAIANAGPNATICQGSAYTLNGSSAQYQVTINWTTTGTGTFSNPGILHPVYTPGNADILAGTVTLTMTVTSNPPCTSANSSMTLTINKAPVANAGPNSNTCQGVAFTVTSATAQNYTSILWTAPGPGTLTNATTLNPVYTPAPAQTGAVILTMTSYGNPPCGNATSQMTLNIVPTPVANAGPNSSVCQGSSFTVLGSSASNFISLLWTTSGTGTFVDPTVLHPIYTPSATDILSGSVVLTLQATGNPPCTSVTSSMTLTIVLAPVANAGPNGTTCQNQAFTVSGASAQNYSSLLWTDNGLGTLTNAGTLTPTYYPAVAETGSVILTLTVTGNVPCGSASSQMTLMIIAAPTAYAGPDATICEGSDYTVIGAAATNYAGLYWTSNGQGTLINSTTLSPTYIPATNEVGNVTLTLTVIGISPCGDAVSSMVLTINPKAVVYAGPDQSSCGQSPVALNAATASDFVSLEWTTTGSGTFNNPAILNPIYTPGTNDVMNGRVVLTLTATAASPCPSVSSSMTLNIAKEAVAYAGGNQSACEGAPYMIQGASAQNYTSLLWTDNGLGTLTGATTLTPVYHPATGETGQVTLILTVTAIAPCPDVSDQMTLTISKSAVAYAGPDTSSCAGAPFTLSDASASNYQSVTWTTSGTGTFNDPHLVNPVYTPSQVDIITGTVVLTMTITPVPPCESASSHMTLTLTGTPVADAGPNGSVCPGVAYAITGATALNYSSILWTTNGSGVLTGSTTLTPTYTPAPGESGTITLTLTIHGTGGCSDATATSKMNIVISNPVTVNAGNDQTIPRNSSTTLLGLASGGSGVYAFSWQPASLLIGAATDHPQTVKLGDNVTFILTVTDVLTGCQNTDSVRILINQGIEAIIANRDRDTTGVNIPINVNILSNDIYSKNLTVGVTLCGGPEHGLADVLSDNTINYSPDHDFSGIDSLCYILCYNQYPDVCDTTKVYIFISTQLPASWLIIHNVITPNGDGINDGWIIDGIEEFPDNTVLIFNRWGDKVNSFDHYNNTTEVWKGDNYQGKPLPDGTYYYIITIQNGGSRTGWILIRGSSK